MDQRQGNTRERTVSAPARLAWMVVLMSGVACSYFGNAAADETAKEWRDPFTFGPRNETVLTGGQILAGVLWDANKPLAMIGQNTVGVGDFIGGWQVVEIHQDGIVVQSGQQRASVSVGGMVPSN